MNQKVTTKGKIIGVTVNNPKSRQSNSSIGYFDLDDKSIIPYNLKHYLSNTLCLTSSVNAKRKASPLPLKPPLGGTKSKTAKLGKAIKRYAFGSKAFKDFSLGSEPLSSRLRHELNNRLSSNNNPGSKASPSGAELSNTSCSEPHLPSAKPGFNATRLSSNPLKSKTTFGKVSYAATADKHSTKASLPKYPLGGVELPWGQTRSVRKRSFQSNTIKHSAQTAFEPGKSSLAGLRGKWGLRPRSPVGEFKLSKSPSKASPSEPKVSSTYSLSFSILPHEVQKNQLLLST